MPPPCGGGYQPFSRLLGRIGFEASAAQGGVVVSAIFRSRGASASRPAPRQRAAWWSQPFSAVACSAGFRVPPRRPTPLTQLVDYYYYCYYYYYYYE